MVRTYLTSQEKNDMGTCENIWKIATDQWDDYRIG